MLTRHFVPNALRAMLHLFKSTMLVASLLAGVISETKSAEPTTASRCAVRQDPDGWWFVAPTDEKFFSLGVCMFNRGLEGEEYDPQQAGLRRLATL